ncbi:MAG: hypothetical protein R8N24_00180, partial [Alphaproteobacteria bacterium]|nr:hypothetical protein [Alphaproteobacteria bacterium]
RKILFAIFAIVFSIDANAWLPTKSDPSGQIINIRYIHELVKQEHGVTIPYADDPNKAANMKYLLTIVDMVNAHFNGDGWTNYGNDPEYATRQAVNTVAGIYCIRDLIERYYFTATTTPDTTSFSFQISAAGTYHVDWGDGKRDHYYKSHTDNRTISHTYDAAGSYNIRIGGYSSWYSSYRNNGVIRFENNQQLMRIAGSLGKIFPTLKDKTDPTKAWLPSFGRLFYNCRNLESEIPEFLFQGVHGQPVAFMFSRLFENCSKLKGTIPPNLFSSIKGIPADRMFESSFSNCIALEGVISKQLFSGIKGNPIYGMFAGAFAGCKALTEIEEGLFDGVQGEPATGMFDNTFAGCVSLTAIPKGLFKNVFGAPASYMFKGTFSGCTGINSVIPPDLFGDIYGAPMEGMYYYTFHNCHNLQGEIPNKLFGDFQNNQPASQMFEGTFISCRGLTKIPEDLFYGIAGAPAKSMYRDTFSGCSALEGQIPDKLFGDFQNNRPANRMFNSTFNGCAKLSGAIPGNLFYRIAGTPEMFMFDNTFTGCVGLTGSIPPNLFGNIYGAPAQSMFLRTFHGCSGLTGAIPDGLFSNIYGTPAQSMFDQTFYGCSGLTGAIPDGLFGDISGVPAAGMFSHTFYGCAKLGTGITDADKPEYMLRGYAIPETLFGRITENSNAAGSMFYATFYNCSGLTGAIPPLLFGGINGLTNGTWSLMFSHTFYNCSGLTGEIPFGLFGDMTGAPQERMFEATFHGCSGLTKIPEYLFGHISGPGALCAYRWVFTWCGNLEGAIPDYLFAGVYGAGTYTFSGAFRGCAKLTSIPEHLFGAVTGFSFDEAFYGCVGLTGPSAKVYVESEGAYKYLYEVWPDVNYGLVYYMDTKLEDYGAWE